jgi:hypothetical protein
MKVRIDADFGASTEFIQRETGKSGLPKKSGSRKLSGKPREVREKRMTKYSAKYSVRVNGDWTRLLEIQFAGFDAGSEITGSYHGGPITGKVLENLKPSQVLQNLGMTDSITFTFEWAEGQQDFVGWRDFKGSTLAGYFTGTVASGQYNYRYPWLATKIA